MLRGPVFLLLSPLRSALWDFFSFASSSMAERDSAVVDPEACPHAGYEFLPWMVHIHKKGRSLLEVPVSAVETEVENHPGVIEESSGLPLE